jgi:hypothetical protein
VATNFTTECSTSAIGPYGSACGRNPAAFSPSTESIACQDCTITHRLGATLDCTGDAFCSADADKGTCRDCRLIGAGAAQDCAGAECSYDEQGSVCASLNTPGPGELGPARCATEFKDGTHDQCLDGERCKVLLPPQLIQGMGRPVKKVYVRKVTNGPDGEFNFFYRLANNELRRGSLDTTGGRSPIAQVWLQAVSQPLLAGVFEERLPTNGPWRFESVECDAAVRDYEDEKAIGVQIDSEFGPPEISCIFRNRYIGFEGGFTQIGPQQPEAVNRTRTFGLPAGNRIAIAGSNGLEFHDLGDGSIPTGGSTLLSFVDIGAPYQDLYGAMVVEHPSGTGADALFAFGQQGLAVRHYDPGTELFGFTQSTPGINVTDAVHIGSDLDAPGVLWVDQSGGRVNAHVWQDFGGQLLLAQASATLVHGFTLFGATGAPVSATTHAAVFDTQGMLLPPWSDADGDGLHDVTDECPDTPEGEGIDAQGCALSELDDDYDGVSNALDLCPDTYEPADENGCSESQTPGDLPDPLPPGPGPPAESSGWVMTVSDGVPGRLWVSDPGRPFAAATLVGDVGDGPRRVRCLASHGICAVSNFDSDSLTIVLWDGEATATIVGSQVVGDGPIGIDLRANGDNVEVISTGFNDNSFTVTTIAPDGSVLASETAAVPEECVNPGHAVWVDESGAGAAVVSCNGSDGYAVVVP